MKIITINTLYIAARIGWIDARRIGKMKILVYINLNINAASDVKNRNAKEIEAIMSTLVKAVIKLFMSRNIFSCSVLNSIKAG